MGGGVTWRCLVGRHGWVWGHREVTQVGLGVHRRVLWGDMGGSGGGGGVT